MKTQKYIVTIEMPDGDMISSGWLKDLIESDCCIEEEDEGRFSISVEEISTSEDLEKEFNKWLRGVEKSHGGDLPYYGEYGLFCVARHFAEWQKEQMGEQAREQLSKTDTTLADLVAFDEGLKLGRRLERQDMLKEAVEGEVKIDVVGHPYIEATELYDYTEFKPLAKMGDRVKIVPIKED